MFDIDRAIERKTKFENKPGVHTYRPSIRGNNMAVKKTFTSEALQYTYDKYIGDDPEQIAAYEQESANIDVAKLIYDLRTKAGLSQRELAMKVDTTASVICRLEDADYEGHSLSMLKRIAAALERRIEIRTVPIRKSASTKTVKTHQGQTKHASRRKLKARTA